METLWAELAGERRPYEVVATVPCEDGGEPLVPYDLPPEVLACWSADQVIVSATVTASTPSRAVAVLEALAPELAGATGSSVTVREADADQGTPARVSGG
jgi:hypothetical protein